MTAIRLCPLVTVLLAAACGSDTTAPTSTTSTAATTVTRSLESFETTLSHGGSTFYSFTASATGTVSVTLASVVQQGEAAAQPTPLRIGLGTPAGEGCAVSDSVDATPALTPQLTIAMTTGIHCVQVEDIGQVTGTVIAAVRFSHL